ncbi:MAG: OmpA family protein [Candidatus Latescibacteria bacterium]|nr:OmpA family protein [Candidatus Latescibacterota bacterium]
MHKKMMFAMLTTAVLAMVLGGCGMSRTQKGAVIGGAAGAVVGGLIGSYLDNQAREMEEIEGAEVQRQGDELRVTFDNAILFDYDSSALKTASQDQLTEVADVLSRYPDTDIMVLGHTDSSGSDDYNQALSERRASAVRGFLMGAGVASSRITARGYGETAPVADNGSESGRAQNRRVELNVQVNEEFRQRAAEQG